MHDLLSVVAKGMVLYTSTNIDDMFILIGFLSEPRVRIRSVAVGQFLGIGVLYVSSVVGSVASLVVPPAVIGLLGLIPIVVGVKKWLGLHPARVSGFPLATESTIFGGRSNVWTVVVATVVNGGDNMSIYIPFFATRSGYNIAVIGGVFACMTGVWLLFAHWLIRHRAIGAPMREYANRLGPYVLIMLGVFILYDSGTFVHIRK
jgi:cadmium resistance protein CadD (predicted permease)